MPESGKKPAPPSGKSARVRAKNSTFEQKFRAKRPDFFGLEARSTGFSRVVSSA
jgi:hypothetical protein